VRASFHFWLVLAIGGFFTDLSISEVQAQLFGERNLGGGFAAMKRRLPRDPFPKGVGWNCDRSIPSDSSVANGARMHLWAGRQIQSATLWGETYRRLVGRFDRRSTEPFRDGRHGELPR
jgi:hypothetical protein